MPLSPIKAAAQERIVRQNTELAEFVSKLNEEKKELRNALGNLEEQITQYRQRERTNEQVQHTAILYELKIDKIKNIDIPGGWYSLMRLIRGCAAGQGMVF